MKRDLIYPISQAVKARFRLLASVRFSDILHCPQTIAYPLPVGVGQNFLTQNLCNFSKSGSLPDLLPKKTRLIGSENWRPKPSFFASKNRIGTTGIVTCRNMPERIHWPHVTSTQGSSLAPVDYPSLITPIPPHWGIIAKIWDDPPPPIKRNRQRPTSRPTTGEVYQNNTWAKNCQGMPPCIGDTPWQQVSKNV